MSQSPGVAIIGCGLIGQKRSRALGDARLVVAADIEEARARSLAAGFPDCDAVTDRLAAVRRPDVDIVIVATTNDALVETGIAAADAGKHVLIEKPVARSLKELDRLIEAVKRNGVLVRTGFNHRYHRALRAARKLVDAGRLGQLMFIRGRYGHGGRVGYDREWRADPARSGGGELLDQGTHLIDLSRWFLGDFTEVHGFVHTYFWDMPVEDNGFMILKTETKQAAFLHASCTEWKNLFSLELFGRDGKLVVEGLGGSYGVERLTFFRMLPEMGPPETTVWEYPCEDDSWAVEFGEFIEDIRLGRKPAVGLSDAREILQVVEKIYRDCGYDNHT